MTLGSLERRLRAQAHAVRVRIVPMEGNDGLIVWLFGDKQVALRSGMRRRQRLSTLLHELLHSSCRAELAPFGELEEPVVLAMEREMLRFVESSSARLDWWLSYMERIPTKGGA